MEYKIEELFCLQMGKTPSRNNPKYWNEQKNKWISIADLSKANKYINDTKEYISDEAIKESGINLIPQNTIVMSFKLSIGKVAITSEPMYSNEAVMAFINKGKVYFINEYLYYLFLHQNWNEYTNKAVKGNTLNKAILSKIKIKIHNIEQQKKIVDVLDKVENLIDNRQQQLNLLDELIKSKFIEMFGDPVINEKDFPIKLLSTIADIKIGPFGSLLHKEDYVIKQHALVNPSHIIEDKIQIDEKLTVSDEKYNELKYYQLKKNDIVLARRGEMGRAAIVNSDGLLCGTGSLIIRVKRDISPYFLQQIITYPTYKKYIADKALGITMQNLNVPIVSKFAIPIYPVELQSKFIVFVEQTEKTKSTIKKSLDELNLLKDSLMQKYFG